MATVHRTYEEAAAHARQGANQLKIAHGIERQGRNWRVFLLPRPENRYGLEARCEAVEPGSPLSTQDIEILTR